MEQLFLKELIKKLDSLINFNLIKEHKKLFHNYEHTKILFAYIKLFKFDLLKLINK